MKIAYFLLLHTILLLSGCEENNRENDMGLFDKLLGKKSSTSTMHIEPAEKRLEMEKTSRMMEEDFFWNLIERSIENSPDQENQAKFLHTELKQLTPAEIIGFRLRTDKLLYDTYSSEMWCAAYIMNGGCSDDCFEYFRLWVISRGKKTYYKAKENPDSLISEVDTTLDYYEFEPFWYIPLEAFKQKTGYELYDYIDNEKFTTREGNYPHFEFTWQEDTPESLENICPELYKKFW